MAVIYMEKLEQEPQDYEKLFSALTKGVNNEVRAWIIDNLDGAKSILEIGSGPGVLAIKLAQGGKKVFAIEKNLAMLKKAKEDAAKIGDLPLEFKWDTVKTMVPKKEAYDVVISTFVLSELRPLEQQIYLRKAWQSLKPNGKLIIADEFIPSGISRIKFLLKRWYYKKKLGRKRSGEIHPMSWFLKYPEKIGFSLEENQEWQGGSIKTLIYRKVVPKGKEDAGYYRPEIRSFNGIKSKFRKLRCLLTGQVDHVAIEPGLYTVGEPDKNSPIIVTANYDYTYIKLMNDIQNLDAWVLCVDSRGINVWCGARGGNFGNMQLIEAVEATGISNLVENRVLILPQLSAGGIESPKLKKNEDFPFSVKFGPVWSKDLPKYLDLDPKRKPESMKMAKFTLSHRITAGITHFTFSLRKIFWMPIFGLLIASILFNLFQAGFLSLEIFLSLLTVHLFLVFVFPLMRFTRKFIIKGLIIGIFNLISWFILLLFTFSNEIISSLWHLPFHFALGFFLTMSFSGYTMATSPREISEEYSTFIILNSIFLITGVILIIVGQFV